MKQNWQFSMICKQTNICLLVVFRSKNYPCSLYFFAWWSVCTVTSVLCWHFRRTNITVCDESGKYFVVVKDIRLWHKRFVLKQNAANSLQQLMNESELDKVNVVLSLDNFCKLISLFHVRSVSGKVSDWPGLDWYYIPFICLN